MPCSGLSNMVPSTVGGKKMIPGGNVIQIIVIKIQVHDFVGFIIESQNGHVFRIFQTVFLFVKGQKPECIAQCH